jgi:hypothetical protein
MTEILNFPARRDPEKTPLYRGAYMQGYRDAIDDAMRAALIAQVGKITTEKEFCLRHEIVEEIRSLRGKSL